jgi:hypothetical protein
LTDGSEGRPLAIEGEGNERFEIGGEQPFRKIEGLPRPPHIASHLTLTLFEAGGPRTRMDRRFRRHDRIAAMIDVLRADHA